jgi:hypothetical protein
MLSKFPDKKYSEDDLFNVIELLDVRLKLILDKRDV